MSQATYSQKLRRRGKAVEHVVIVYPFTYVNPYNCMPPIGPEYVQSAVVHAGRRTTLLDMRFETDVRRHLAAADVVVLYGFFEDCSLFGKWDVHVIDEVLAQVPPDTPVVAGGTGFSNATETLALRPAVDAVMIGMPTVPIQELLATGTPEGVKNVTWRSEDGVVANPRTTYPMTEDLFPKRALRNPAYRYHTLGIPMDLVRAAQGCNFKCRFCYQYGKDTDGKFLRWQGRSPESLARELSEVDATILLWVDDDMTTDMEALERLSDLLVERKIRKFMIGTGRIDHVLRSNVGVLQKLERAGFVALTFGVESLKDEMLRFYRKAQTVDMVERAVAMMQATNIMLVCNFLLGSPGDSEADMMKFLEAGRRWKVDHLVTNRLRVPEGSELHRLITDPATGLPLPGKERIRGRRLKRIKNRIKFGQGTPFHVVRTILKLERHRGLPFDPIYLACRAVRALASGTWLQRSGLLSALLFVPEQVSRLRAFRHAMRGVATVLHPLVDAMTQVFDGIDRRLHLSTRTLPQLAELFSRTVFERQEQAEQPAPLASRPVPLTTASAAPVA